MMETAYLHSGKAFVADDRKIINAIVGGQLTVFERVKYEDLFISACVWKRDTDEPSNPLHFQLRIR
jgi:hypothetical protein